MMLIESPRTLEHRETGVRVTGATHWAFAGPRVSGASARVRRGLGKGIEVAGEASAHKVMNAGSADLRRGIYSARLSTKYAPVKHLAFSLGFGGGYAPSGGGFVSPDAAVFLGYENPYFVPFTSVRWFASEPIRPQPVDVSEPNQPPGTRVLSPQHTQGTSLALGARIPVGEWPERDAPWAVQPNFIVAFGWSWLRDEPFGTAPDRLWNFGGAVELVF